MRSDSIDVRTLASPLTYPRVGIVVPRFRHTVVERNRVRRRLRELVRTLLLPTLRPQDVLLRAEPASYSLSFGELQREVEQIAERLEDAR